MFTSEKYTSQNYSICTVALFGDNDPFFFNGHLILKTYYSDNNQTAVDVEKTSHFTADTLFYETNKVIREMMQDSYNGKRDLIELSLPELGNEYRINYNASEKPSERYDDSLAILSNRDSKAKGVAIILKRDAKGIHYLNEAEARKICSYYTNE